MRTVPIHESHVVSNSGETIRAGIDAENLVQVLGVLTDLYSDPVLAVIREYSTNGFDAQIEAGYDGPLEVTLPDVEKSGPGTFVVKDHGVGLDMDELRKTYLSYGASTKRESDDYNGTLGLGSKSGLTYAPNGFQVRAVKDGALILAVVARGTDGVGEMSILHQGPTSEPNGVTITIPVDEDDKWEFKSTAEQFYAYWAPGSVLVDGEQPASVKDDDRLIWLDDDVAIGRNIDSKIVMGNVAYNLNAETRWNYGVVAYVPMGAVHFTPSREELHYTDHTNETVEMLVEFVNERAEAEIIRSVIEAPTPFDRLLAAAKIRETFQYRHAAAKRFDRLVASHLPARQVQLPKASVKHRDGDGTVWHEEQGWSKSGYTWNGHNGRNTISTFNSLHASTLLSNHRETIVVVDFPFNPRTLGAGQRDRLGDFSRWLRSQDGQSQYRSRFLILPVNDFGTFRPEMLEGHPAVYTWDYIVEKTPREKAQRGSGPRHTTIYKAKQDGLSINSTEFDPSNGPIVFQDWGMRRYDDFSTTFPEVQVVYLMQSQIAKFERLHPTAQPAYKYRAEQVAKATAALTDGDTMRWYAPEWEWLKGCEDRIDDVELAEVVRSLTSRSTVRIDRAKTLGVSRPEQPEVFARLAERYPLLDMVDDWQRSRVLDDILLYMNARWAQVEEEREVVEAAQALADAASSVSTDVDVDVAGGEA